MKDNKEELIASLRKLLSDAPRTKMGRVFEIYDSLVDLRNSGVSAGDIEKLLNDKEGIFKFDLPPGSLTSYMHRIKLKKAAIDDSPVKAKKSSNPKTPVIPGSDKLDVKDSKQPKAPAAPGKLDVVKQGVSPTPPAKPTVDQEKVGVLNKYGCDTTDVDDVFSSMLNKGK